MIPMRSSTSAGQHIITGLEILNALVLVAFLFSRLLTPLHYATTSILLAFLVTQGIWYLAWGVRKIGQSQSNPLSLAWYKKPQLTRGLAALFFGLVLLLSLLASFLPGGLEGWVEGALAVVLLLPALILFILSIIFR